MHGRYFYSVVFCICLTYCTAEDKWVWSKERKSGIVETETARITVAKPILNDNNMSASSRKIDEHLARLFDEDDDYQKARYEVQEAVDYVNGRPIPAKPRPFSRPANTQASFLNQRPYPDRPLYPDRPFSERYPSPSSPSVLIQGPRPNEFLSPLQSGNSHTPVRRQPPGPAIGILTGPVPSWEKPILNKNGDPTNFEHCKCSFSFNCKSPGIQFGSCDQGKTYCCHNEFNSAKDGLVQPNAFGSTNVERFDKIPAVLVGPGGPGRPPLDLRESYRPYHAENEFNGNIDPLGYRRQPYGIIPQKPVLPPYMGFHNDYRSSK